MTTISGAPSERDKNFPGSYSSSFESKADYITRTLRRQILDGTLGPGAELRQRDVAAMFEVSPTPVREALNRLNAEGYVVMRLHHGASVVRSPVERRQENWRIRANLESLAAELATERVTAEEVEEIAALAAAFELATEESEAHRLNRDFHFCIYRAAGSPVLFRFLEDLWQALDVAPSAFREHDTSARQHFDILDAIREGDAESAARLTYIHISETARYQQAEDAGQTLGSPPVSEAR